MTSPETSPMNTAASFNPFVSMFGPLGKGPSIPKETCSIRRVLADIQGGKYRDEIEKIRAQPAGSPEQKKLKLELPSFTAAGVFAEGASIKGSNPIQFSGLGQIDIDGSHNLDMLPDATSVAKLRDSLGRDPHVFAAFASPTNTGIKALIRIDAETASYKHSMASARTYIQQTYGLIPDTIDDVQRLCFVSHDPDLVINDSAIALPHIQDNREENAEDQPEDALDHVRLPAEGITIPSAEKILQHLDANMAYSEWLKVGCGIKHQFPHAPDEAFALFDKWSSTGHAKYIGTDDVRVTWNSLKANPADRDPVTFATIIHMAKKSGYQSGKSLPPIVAIRDILANPPERPVELIHGVLFKGRKLIMAAPSKARKTWTNLDQAISVATGTSWLGFATTQSPVLYLDFELGDYEFSQRLKEVMKAKRAGLDIPLYRWPLRGRTLDIHALLPKMRAFALENHVGLIVIDPLYAALQGRDENSNSEMTDLMFELEHLAQETEAAISIVHHYAKGNPSVKEAQDRMSGAGALARTADAMLLLTPHADDSDAQPVHVAEFITRSFPKPPRTVLRWDHPLWVIDKKRNPGDLKRLGGRKPEHKLDELVDLLDGGKLTFTELRERAEAKGISPTTFKRLLKKGCEEGVLEKNENYYSTIL